MSWLACSLAGSSEEKTQLDDVSCGGEQKRVGDVQVRRTGIKVQVQGLTANGDSLEICLIELFGIGGHSAIIRASSGGSSSVDTRWSGCTQVGVLSINARQCNRTGYLLAWQLGCTLRNGEFGIACDVACTR